MAGIPREVLRWLLSLNINLHHRKLKWHVSNGVLAAEIIHNYQPKVVDLGKFIDGQSIEDNVASSELKTEPDLFCNQKKVQSLALAYKNMKLTERMAEPRRYRVFRPLASHCRRSESSELRNIVHNEKADIMSANVLHEETSMSDTVLTIQPKQQAVFE
ncbi:unnamed protein product [Heterobilharzia americana]|nr:unnamed protein product [Heterobilharzia americana]